MKYIDILNKHKSFFSFLAILIIVAAIPITVFVSQKQQEIRQRAQELPAETSLYFTLLGYGGEPRTALVQPVGANDFQVVTFLYLDTKGVDVSGFDIELQLPKDAVGIIVEERKGARMFNFLQKLDTDEQNKRIRFSKINVDPEGKTKIIGGLPLLSVVFLLRSCLAILNLRKLSFYLPILPGHLGTLQCLNSHLL